MAEFNPLEISAKDTKKGLLDNYSDRRDNSLRLAQAIVESLVRHELNSVNIKLLKAKRNGCEIGVTVGEIDNLIIQLMQARRHIADVEKCDAVISALNQIKL